MTEVVVERRSDDRDKFTEKAWIGTFHGPLVSGKQAERWLPFEGERTVVFVAEEALPIVMVVLAQESGIPVLQRLRGGDPDRAVVVGEDCGPKLVGHVGGEEGVERPAIDGAHVKIEEVGGLRLDLPENVLPSWRTSRGVVEIPCMVAGHYTVSISAEGYLPVEDELVILDEPPWSFDVMLLPDGRWVRGEVVGPDGIGVEGADIVALSGGESYQAVSGVGGTFVVGPLPGREATVFAHAGEASSKRLGVEIPSDWLRVELAPNSIGGRILGRVFDEATNAPVEMFEVMVHPLSSPGWDRVYEGADGEFEVVVESERVVIQVRAEGYATWAGEPALDLGRSRSLDVPLRRGTLVEGVVFSSTSGEPVERAKVYGHGFLWQGGVKVTPPAVTDSRGRFELRTDRDSPCLGVRAQGFAPKVACSSGSGEWSIGLDGGGEILGRLGLPDGTPARGSVGLTEARSGKAVGFWDLWLREGVHRSALVEDGRFRFGDLPPGRYVVSASSTEGVVESRTATVAGAVSREVRLVVKPLARVTGTVSGLGPGERARLMVHRESSEEHAVGQLPAVQHVGNGAFQISGISNGQYVLLATSDQDRETIVDFEILDSDDVEVDVVFEHSARLWGRVLSGGSGVPHTKVFARDVESPARGLAAFTDDDGSYSFAGLANGTHEVVVLGNHFHVDVWDDTELDLPLAVHSISGVVRARGRPWPTVRMYVRPLDLPDGPPWWTTSWGHLGPYVIDDVTGGDGDYRFEGLPEGRYEVVAMAPYEDGTTKEIFVNSDVEGVDFHLRPTTDLRPIRVVPHSGVGEEIELSAQGGIYAGLPEYGVYLPLDELGMTEVPGRLVGADLRIVVWRPIRSVTRIPHWDGGPITVRRAEEAKTD